jgi:aminoglycoside 6'-N-acetyltransferase I
VDSITIRRATPDDAPTLGSLLDQLGYPTDAARIPDRLTKLYARPGTTILVAEAQGRVVGCVTVHLFHAMHLDEPAAWLTALVVDQSARGQGVGSALVKSAEEWAMQHGAPRISLTSALRRKEAHEFYKSRDYEHTGVRLEKRFARSAPQPGSAQAGESSTTHQN